MTKMRRVLNFCVRKVETTMADNPPAEVNDPLNFRPAPILVELMSLFSGLPHSAPTIGSSEFQAGRTIFALEKHRDRNPCMRGLVTGGPWVPSTQARTTFTVSMQWLRSNAVQSSEG